MKLGYPPIDIKFADRKAYYDAFDSHHNKGGVRAMVNLFGKYLLERLNKYINIMLIK